MSVTLLFQTLSVMIEFFPIRISTFRIEMLLIALHKQSMFKRFPLCLAAKHEQLLDDFS